MTILSDLESMMRPDVMASFRRDIIKAGLQRPVEVSEDVINHVVFPLLWMLERVGSEGIRLTEAGYLAPAVVSEAMAALGWDQKGYGKANRENQAVPVLTIRKSLQQLRLLHRRNGVLRITKAGMHFVGQPRKIWDLLATALPVSRDDAETRAWHFYLLSLACAPDERQSFHDRAVAHGLWSIGWVTRSGDRLADRDAFDLIAQPWRLMLWLGAFTDPDSLDEWRVATSAMVEFARYGLTRATPGDEQEGATKNDREEMNAAPTCAVERSNAELFIARGDHRERALLLLRLIAEAFAEDGTSLVDIIMAEVKPDPGPDGTPSVEHVIGLSLELLDRWYSDPLLATNLGGVRMPQWHSRARKAAIDIIALARTGRAYGSIGDFMSRNGDEVVLHGSVLAIAATLGAWAPHENASVRELGLRVLAEAN